MGFHIPHEKRQFWRKGAPILKYRDFLPRAVRKTVVDLGGPKEPQVQLHSPGGANVPDNILPMSCAKMAETIDLLFGLWTWVSQSKHKFDRICQVAPMSPHRRARWRHLANTTEPSVCGSDAALLLLLFFRAGVQPTLDPYAEAFL